MSAVFDVESAPPQASKAALGRPIAIWLLVCCAMVFGMIVVGGATRLTHSGLSITEWQPILGTLPPLTAGDWQQAFDKYKATPEYQKVNSGMSLDEFKGIFWWEYCHRLLGRTIGTVFLLPLLWFWWRGMIGPPLRRRLIAIFILGGLQGALGWYMVQSGLVDEPRVSQFRLTAHLLLAFTLYAAMLWTALGLLRSSVAPDTVGRSRLGGLAWLVLAVVLYMVTTGGFVAGIRAGFAYNTFPLMNGHVVPPEIMMIEPWWKNFFYNMATVQFDHRAGAWLLAVLVPALWWRSRAPGVSSRVRHAADVLLGMLAVQIALGISTLLLVVPVGLAATHQAGAVLLFSAALNLVHALRSGRAADR
ncbi:MAG TPA: COX15/CtaA family protein [Burkholderiales bacterium]|nr:COX15/CtaA family protein [Burkholderiales bacterium]